MKGLLTFCKALFINIHVNTWKVFNQSYSNKRKPSTLDHYSRSSIACSVLFIINLIPIVLIEEREDRTPYSVFFILFTILSFYFFFNTSTALKHFKWADDNKEKVISKVANIISWAYLLSAFITLWISIFSFI